MLLPITNTLTNEDIPQIMKQAVPEIHEEGEKIRFRSSEQVKLCLFDLNLSMKPVKKCFVYKWKLSLGLQYFIWQLHVHKQA